MNMNNSAFLSIQIFPVSNSHEQPCCFVIAKQYCWSNAEQYCWFNNAAHALFRQQPCNNLWGFYVCRIASHRLLNISILTAYRHLNHLEVNAMCVVRPTLVFSTLVTTDRRYLEDIWSALYNFVMYDPCKNRRWVGFCITCQRQFLVFLAPNI